MKTSAISKLPFLLLFVMTSVLMTATVVEHFHGSSTAYAHIYGSWAFRILWAFISVSGIVLLVRRRLWRKPTVFALHLSFLFILCGALTTALTAVNGSIHLRKGTPARFFLTDNGEVRELPFELTLHRFEVQHYPGTSAPSDYVSTLFADGKEHTVSMNCIFKRDNYRFYQSSFDDDLSGTTLSINHDPYGIALTYSGYLMLLLSMSASLSVRNGTFRRLLRHPALRRSAWTAGVSAGLLIPYAAPAHSNQSNLSHLAVHFSHSAHSALSVLSSTQSLTHSSLPTLRRTFADSVGRRQIVYNNRVCPLNTLATDFVKKLYGRATFRGLTSEQVLLSWLSYPEAWNDVPIIKIKHGELRRRLGVSGEYAALGQLYAGNEYQLQRLLQADNNTNSALTRAIHETDEKVGLILMLHKGTLIRPLSPEDTHARLSPRRVRLEIIYNRLPIVRVAFMGNLLLGIIAFFALTMRVRSRRLQLAFRTALFLSLLLLAIAFCIRWYIGGFIPMSNGFETMLFMSLCSLSLSALLMRRFPFAVPFGFLLAGFSLLVAHLSDMNPQITPLMPVLSSPLLCLHVTIVMLSYALFAFMCLNSLYALWLLRGDNAAQVSQLSTLNRLLLHPAVFLLAGGIFVGAVWANISWGRYWGWDPKEVWALITMLIYSFALHTVSLPVFRRPRVFHWFMALAFLCVVMTYFGVNFLLGGLHSYA